jgi:hypothetical protein
VGAWFAVGNLMLDVAALNKEEMIPWEKWSLGRECGLGQDPSPACADKFDAVARLLAGTPDWASARPIF